MNKHDVEITQIELNTGSELSDSFYRNCSFCEKLVKITPFNFNSCQNLGGNDYCPFCLRHDFNRRDNQNILVFSFRGIIGYYYHRLYKCNPMQMWESEIEAMIDRHVLIGLHSPTLTYDPFTMLWFMDFNKIGNEGDNHKAPFKEVFHTIDKMYDVFDLRTNINQAANVNLWARFKDAIELFNEQRKRPKDKKILIPTLFNFVSQESEEFFETTRLFTRSCLVVK